MSATAHDWVKTIASGAQIVALLVGSTWGAYLLWQQRELAQKINVRIEASAEMEINGYHYFRIIGNLENVGGVRFQVNEVTLNLVRMAPVASEEVNLAPDEDYYQTAANMRISWPPICSSVLHREISLEPGESWREVFEIWISNEVSKVIAEFGVLADTGNSDRGWFSSSVVTLSEVAVGTPDAAGQSDEGQHAEQSEEGLPPIPSFLPDGRGELGTSQLLDPRAGVAETGRISCHR